MQNFVGSASQESIERLNAWAKAIEDLIKVRDELGNKPIVSAGPSGGDGDEDLKELKY